MVCVCLVQQSLNLIEKITAAASFRYCLIIFSSVYLRDIKIVIFSGYHHCALDFFSMLTLFNCIQPGQVTFYAGVSRIVSNFPSLLFKVQQFAFNVLNFVLRGIPQLQS